MVHDQEREAEQEDVQHREAPGHPVDRQASELDYSSVVDSFASITQTLAASESLELAAKFDSHAMLQNVGGVNQERGGVNSEMKVDIGDGEFNASDENLVKISDDDEIREQKEEAAVLLEMQKIAARTAKEERKQRRLQRKADRENKKQRDRKQDKVQGEKVKGREPGIEDDDDEMKFIALVSDFKDKIIHKSEAMRTADRKEASRPAMSIEHSRTTAASTPAHSHTHYSAANTHTYTHDASAMHDTSSAALTINIEPKDTKRQEVYRKAEPFKREVVLPTKERRSEWRKAHLSSTSSSSHSAMPSIELTTESLVLYMLLYNKSLCNYVM